MLELINEERTSRGLNPVQLELRLNDAAGDHSEWMLETNNFSHTGAGGSSAGERMQDADFVFSGSWTWAENIAWQSERGALGLSDDVINLHNSFMNSSGHRANILNPNVIVVGIGIETGTQNGFEAVMITQNFAKTSAPLRIEIEGGGKKIVAAGTAGDDWFALASGTAGDLSGLGGNDVLEGSSARNTLYGGAGNDVLEGKGGADYLEGGSGADHLNGGSGTDQARYKTAANKVTADLQDASKNSGEAKGDKYSSIENLAGSNYGDSLRGDRGGNHLSGLGGDDTFYGRVGSDKLYGGNGNDTLFGGSGSDKLYGNDVKQDFNPNNNAEDIDLSGVSEITNFSDLQNNHMAQVGANVIITQGSNTITLEDVNINNLGSGDFLFRAEVD